MLDQSFSADNFLKIFHLENRKGTFNKYLLSEKYINKHEEVKTLFSKKATLPQDDFDKSLQDLNKQKEDLLEEHLIETSEAVNSSSFQFAIAKFKSNDKDIYTINQDAASFFAIKQLQYNILRTFKVKQSNRYNIVKDVKNILSTYFPRYLVKTDVKGFYESIPQDLLFNKIDENQLLNYKSRNLIKSLIWKYETIKDKSLVPAGKGIPRGVGVSAFLAELYMREIDREIMSLHHLVYYARYVDDIVAIFSPDSEETKYTYLKEITTIIEAHHLVVNLDPGEKKSFDLRLYDDKCSYDFDFLGYKFVIRNSIVDELKLSTNKVTKYDERLRVSVSDYNTSSKYNEREARKLLYMRLRFLTGNFRLINNRKNIKAGVYYTNVLLNQNTSEEIGDLKHLDNLLTKNVFQIQPYAKLKVDLQKLREEIVRKFSFKAGYDGVVEMSKGIYVKKMRFHSFDEEDFKKITKVWKY